MAKTDSRSGEGAGADRRERLAAELRANLKRRKDQARARSAGGSSAADKAEAPTPVAARKPVAGEEPGQEE